MAGYFYGKNTNPVFPGAIPGISGTVRDQPPGASQDSGGGGTTPPETDPRKACYDGCIKNFPAGYNRSKCIADCAKMPKRTIGEDSVIKKPSLITSAPGAKSKGDPWAGCPERGKKYMLGAGETACEAGYVPISKPEGTQCECVKWCQDIGYGADCKSGAGGTTSGQYKFPAELNDLYLALIGKGKNLLTDWNFSPEMKSYMDALMGRGREALEKKPGYSESFLNAAMTGGADTMRRQAAATKAAQLRSLQSQGLLGTGAGQAAISDLDLTTSQGVGGMIRDLLISNEEKKKADYIDMTGLAQSIFGQGMEFEKTPATMNMERAKVAQLMFSTGMDYNTAMEMINAGRRGEGSANWAMWLEYIKSLMASYGA